MSAVGAEQRAIRLNWRQRHWLGILLGTTAGALGLLLAHQLSAHQFELRRWDYMLVSGCIATIGGLWLARGQPERFDLMLARLEDRRALTRGEVPLEEDDFVSIRAGIQRRSRRLALYSGITLATLIAVLWFVAWQNQGVSQDRLDEYFGPAVGAVGGALVGWVLGRMISYGLLGRFLAGQGVSFNATPAHPDGAAGLKPLADYYVFQALLLALAAAYLLVWSLVMFTGIDSRYEDRWLKPYLGLLALAICLELLAFVAPLWFVHKDMATRKRAELEAVDKSLTAKIQALREQLGQDMPTDRRSELKGQLDELVTQYGDAESMPTWPIDPSIRRRVTIGNLILAIPLAGQIVKLTE